MTSFIIGTIIPPHEICDWALKQAERKPVSGEHVKRKQAEARRLREMENNKKGKASTQKKARRTAKPGLPLSKQVGVTAGGTTKKSAPARSKMKADFFSAAGPAKSFTPNRTLESLRTFRPGSNAGGGAAMSANTAVGGKRKAGGRPGCRSSRANTSRTRGAKKSNSDVGGAPSSSSSSSSDGSDGDDNNSEGGIDTDSEDDIEAQERNRRHFLRSLPGKVTCVKRQADAIPGIGGSSDSRPLLLYQKKGAEAKWVTQESIQRSRDAGAGTLLLMLEQLKHRQHDVAEGAAYFVTGGKHDPSKPGALPCPVCGQNN